MAHRLELDPVAVAECAMLITAALLVITTAEVRWVRTGNGSSFTGLDLADSLRGGVLSPSWGRWAGAAIYATVAAGGILLALALKRRGPLVRVRLLVSLLLIGGLAVLSLSGRFPVGDWSLGPWMAMTGALATVAVSLVQVGRLQRATAGPDMPTESKLDTT